MFSEEEWTRYGDELRRPLLIAKGLAEASSVLVVGGGLSGLCVAYRLATKRPDLRIELIEKSDRLGGAVETWSNGEWLCDVAVNAARAHPAFWRLVRDLELGEAFAPSNPAASSRWIHVNGKRTKLSPLLVLRRGPLKVLRGVRSSRKGKQSVAQTVPLGAVADAMTLGIVNDLAANVDADFLMPSMTKYGANPPVKPSVVRRKMNATYPLFTPRKGATASFAGGFQTLVDRLVERLEQLDNVHCSLGVSVASPEALAAERGQPLSSIVWCAPSTGGPPNSLACPCTPWVSPRPMLVRCPWDTERSFLTKTHRSAASCTKATFTAHLERRPVIVCSG